jgi:DNA repair protein RecN (Recombination protein N)
MLRFLSIRNLAVIDHLELEFEPGLTVLTGETGAGKSILVGAVGLLAGGRASTDLVRTGEETAILEAIFDAPDDGETIVRREVSAQGRSRAFVNGSLVTSAALKDLAGGLVDLHGQHEHQVLLDPAAHGGLLDAFAGADGERQAVGEAFARWRALVDERERLAAAAREHATRQEFLAFQLAEIDKVAPQPGEDAELSATRSVLANADRLQRLCAEAYDALYDGEHAALESLAVVWRRLADLEAIDPRFTPHLQGRDTVKPLLEDLAFFLRSYAAGIDASPARLQDVEDRLAALERLKRKHGPTIDDVLARREALARDLDDLVHSVERQADLEGRVRAARDEYKTLADALGRRRRDAAVEFERRLTASLADLAMPHTRCEVRFTPAAGEAQWTAQGTDAIEFYISPNPGEDLRPLARIVSGGELSRIMLALKTLASTDAAGKTLIFDEVDAGIGGAVADVVGARLRRLGERFQVLSITHMPQIAAYGTAHFQIAKTVRTGRTATGVRRLTPGERVDEIARMIAGTTVSDPVRASATEMLAAKSGAGRPGSTAKGEQSTKGESERSRSRRG